MNDLTVDQEVARIIAIDRRGTGVGLLAAIAAASDEAVNEIAAMTGSPGKAARAEWNRRLAVEELASTTLTPALASQPKEGRPMKRDAIAGELQSEPDGALEEMARGRLGVTPATREMAKAELAVRRARLDVDELETRELRTLVKAPIGEVAETTRELARVELESREALGDTGGRTERA